MLRRYLLAAALAVYLLILFDLMLLQFSQPGAAPNFVPFVSMTRDLHDGGRPFVVNFLGNLGVFIPVGALLPVIRRQRRTTIVHVLIVSAALSIAIELAQLASGRRVCDIDDVILNTLGGALGYLAFVVAAKLAARWSQRR